MRKAWTLSLMLLCAACRGDKSSAKRCDVGGLAKLAEHLDTQAPGEEMLTTWHELQAVCRDALPNMAGQAYDVPAIAAQRRSARAFELDAQSMQMLLAACPDWAEVERALADAPSDQRAYGAFRGCNFARFGVFGEDDFEHASRPMIATWSMHAWFLEQGLEVEAARRITRELYTLEQRNELLWMAPGEVELPVAEGSPVPRGPSLVITPQAIMLDDQKLALVDEGRPPSDTPEGLIRPLYEALRQAMTGLEQPPMPLIIADASTSFELLYAVVYTAERAGLRELALVVGSEDGLGYAQLPVRASGRWARVADASPGPAGAGGSDGWAGYVHQPDNIEEEEPPPPMEWPVDEPDAREYGKMGKPTSKMKSGLYAIKGPMAALPRYGRSLEQGALGETPRLSVELAREGYSVSERARNEGPPAFSSADDWAALTTRAEAFAAEHRSSNRALVSAAPTVPLSRLVIVLEALHGRECDAYSGAGCYIDEVVLVREPAHDFGTAPAASGSPGVSGLDTREGAIGLGNTGVIGGRPTEARVRLAKARVEGGLSEDLIRRVVRTNIKDVRDCYEDALARDPSLEGKVTITFTISGRGRVSSSVVSASTLKEAALPTCIAAAAKRWRFPAPPSGSVSVAFPFGLSPG